MHAARSRVEEMGPVSQRAPVGNGARGLQRRRRRMGLSARSAPLSLGRRRSRGFLRSRAAAVPVAGAMERPRSDFEGAIVRPHQRRRQSRRGRQGALLLPRRDTDTLVPEDPSPEDRYFECSSSMRRQCRRRADARHGSQPRSRGRDVMCCPLSFATPGHGARRGEAAAGIKPDTSRRSSISQASSWYADQDPALLFTDNDTNTRCLYSVPNAGYRRTRSTSA